MTRSPDICYPPVKPSSPPNRDLTRTDARLEYLSVLISIVLGLGVTHLLVGAVTGSVLVHPLPHSPTTAISTKTDVRIIRLVVFQSVRIVQTGVYSACLSRLTLSTLNANGWNGQTAHAPDIPVKSMATVSPHCT